MADRLRLLEAMSKCQCGGPSGSGARKVTRGSGRLSALFEDLGSGHRSTKGNHRQRLPGLGVTGSGASVSTTNLFTGKKKSGDFYGRHQRFLPTLVFPDVPGRVLLVWKNMPCEDLQPGSALVRIYVFET